MHVTVSAQVELVKKCRIRMEELEYSSLVERTLGVRQGNFDVPTRLDLKILSRILLEIPTVLREILDEFHPR